MCFFFAIANVCPVGSKSGRIRSKFIFAYSFGDYTLLLAGYFKNRPVLSKIGPYSKESAKSTGHLMEASLLGCARKLQLNSSSFERTLVMVLAPRTYSQGFSAQIS